MNPWRDTRSVVVATLAASMCAGCATVHTEVFVPAPPEVVWGVLTDANGYADWNPVFIDADGHYAEGESVRYRVREPDGSEHAIEAKVVRVESSRLLNQFGGRRGILVFDHEWRLQPVQGGTLVTQHEEYRGVGVWFWDESWVEPAYRQANEALRSRSTKSRPHLRNEAVEH